MYYILISLMQVIYDLIQLNNYVSPNQKRWNTAVLPSFSYEKSLKKNYTKKSIVFKNQSDKMILLEFEQKDSNIPKRVSLAVLDGRIHL